MRRGLGVILLLNLGLLTTAGFGAGQEQQQQKPEMAAEPEEDKPKPYVPPSAAKSIEIANFYFRTKKYNAALGRYEEAVTTDPYYAAGYLGLGKTYEKLGLKHKALAAYQKYLDLLPSEKQAEEAKSVHQAIERLEKTLGVKSTAANPLPSAKVADAPR
ncbi:MAG TPA: tetratricopeptide repeat protein [Terriglobia bacterium]|jgi:tetratricopeptide (TPR) repeat protein|nr:tetratricopeptide repeat protein [Terriglobia bacterium]